MHRSVVGLLAAAAATVSVLAAAAHGDLLPLAAATAGLASGLGVYLSLPVKKNDFPIRHICPPVTVGTRVGHTNP
jgi:hypothetical protein